MIAVGLEALSLVGSFDFVNRDSSFESNNQTNNSYSNSNFSSSQESIPLRNLENSMNSVDLHNLPKTSNPFSALQTVSTVSETTKPLKTKSKNTTDSDRVVPVQRKVAQDTKRKRPRRKKKNRSSKSQANEIYEEEKPEEVESSDSSAFGVNCPLCGTELDDSDIHFKPCECGYKVCLYCWSRVMESTIPKCPGCRTQYKNIQLPNIDLKKQKLLSPRGNERECRNCLFRSSASDGICRLCDTKRNVPTNLRKKNSSELNTDILDSSIRNNDSDKFTVVMKSNRYPKTQKEIPVHQKIMDGYHVNICSSYVKDKSCSLSPKACFDSHTLTNTRRKPEMDPSESR